MKKRVLTAIISLTLFAILFSACGGAMVNDAVMEKSLGMDQAVYGEPGMELFESEAPMAARSDGANGIVQTSNVVPEDTVQSNRMIVKNANMSIIVEDPKEALNQVAGLAESLGGFIVSSNISEHETYEGKVYYSADIYIRVPSEKFEGALNNIQGIADSVDYQSISGQDVTSEYVDLESELRSLELAEEQLTKIMDEAYKTEDVLSVFRELQYIQSDIEVIKGRMKYLKESSTFSSISVNFQAKVTIEPITIGKWSPKGIAADALQALVNFGKSLIGFLIWFVIFALPILALIALGIWFLVWLFKKIFKPGKRKNKKEEEKKED